VSITCCIRLRGALHPLQVASRALLAWGTSPYLALRRSLKVRTCAATLQVVRGHIGEVLKLTVTLV